MLLKKHEANFVVRCDEEFRYLFTGRTHELLKQILFELDLEEFFGFIQFHCDKFTRFARLKVFWQLFYQAVSLKRC